MIVINTDASIQPFNPGGIVAWGFIAKRKGKTLHKEAGISVRGGPTATGNVGEYHAVIAALSWLLTLPRAERRPVIIKSDSQLIVNQCAGTWGCKDDKLVPLHTLVDRARREYGRSVTFHWIPREENSDADALSRTAYDPDELERWRENQMDILFDGDDISF